MTLGLEPGTCLGVSASLRRIPALLALATAVNLTPGFEPTVPGALTLLYVVNQWARMLPSFLVSFDASRMAAAGAEREFMNVALGFDQAYAAAYP